MELGTAAGCVAERRPASAAAHREAAEHARADIRGAEGEELLIRVDLVPASRRERPRLQDVVGIADEEHPDAGSSNAVTESSDGRDGVGSPAGTSPTTSIPLSVRLKRAVAALAK